MGLRSRDEQLAASHLLTVTTHIREAGLALRNGTIGKEELAKRLATIAQLAEVYGHYWQRQGGQPNFLAARKKKTAKTPQ